MATRFPRFLTIEEAAQLLGVSVARISLWIGECKLPVAARSEYAGFLLRTRTLVTIGRHLADALPSEARFAPSPDVQRCAGTRREVERIVPPSPPMSNGITREVPLP